MNLWGLANNILTVVNDEVCYRTLNEPFELGEMTIVGIISSKESCYSYIEHFSRISQIKPESRVNNLNHSLPWVYRKHRCAAYFIAHKDGVYHSTSISDVCSKKVLSAEIVGILRVQDLHWREGGIAVDSCGHLVNQIVPEPDLSSHTDARIVLYTLAKLFAPKSTITEYSLGKDKSITRTVDKYPKRVKEKAKELMMALF